MRACRALPESGISFKALEQLREMNILVVPPSVNNLFISEVIWIVCRVEGKSIGLGMRALYRYHKRV